MKPQNALCLIPVHVARLGWRVISAPVSDNMVRETSRYTFILRKWLTSDYSNKKSENVVVVSIGRDCWPSSSKRTQSTPLIHQHCAWRTAHFSQRVMDGGRHTPRRGDPSPFSMGSISAKVAHGCAEGKTIQGNALTGWVSF